MMSRKYIIFSILSSWLCFHSLAQQLASEQVFPVKGYSLFDVGFPSKVVPGTRGTFFFLEYWAQGEGDGEQQRITENYYLQCYGIRGYVEHWFKPVTEEGYETMKVIDLKRLSKGCFVVGEQYVSELDEVHTVGRFFSLEGTPTTEEPFLISSHWVGSRPKKLENKFVTSPQGKCMLWLGKGKNELFASAWGEKGDSIWSQDIVFPVPNKKYTVKDVVVDDSTNAYFLLEHPSSTQAQGGSENPFLLVQYIHSSNTYNVVPIEIPNGNVLDLKLQIWDNMNVLIAGMAHVNDGQESVLNGAKLGAKEEVPYNRLFLKRFRSTEMGEAIADSVYKLPQKWIDAYQEKGTNFSHINLEVFRNSAVLILEEQYVKKKKMYYYDIAIAGIDLKASRLAWTDIVNKRQRDEHSSNYISYVAGFSRNRLRLVYLTERGARGKLSCTSIELDTGKRKDRMLASNEEARHLFFTQRSSMVSAVDMVLLGLGNPAKNDFKLMTVSF